MGLFDGCLLVSDYDNTLRYTAPALRAGREPPPVSPRNIEAIRRWIAGGGRFALATGRALAAIENRVGGIPMNAPAVVDNGGAIYDFAAKRYVVQKFLPAGAAEHIAAVMDAFPSLSLELYHEDDLVQVMRPREWNRSHALLTGLAQTEIDSLDAAAPPLAKALFVGEPADLGRVGGFLAARGWAENYELIFSDRELLEMTARGANKGTMVRELQRLTGCGMLCCAGDHLNDLPMLAAADLAFCPANAEPEVLGSGAAVVCHCLDGAIADAVDRIEQRITEGKSCTTS